MLQNLCMLCCILRFSLPCTWDSFGVLMVNSFLTYILLQLLLLPNPPFKPIYYTLVIIDLCKVDLSDLLDRCCLSVCLLQQNVRLNLQCSFCELFEIWVEYLSLSLTMQLFIYFFAASLHYATDVLRLSQLSIVMKIPQ